MRSVRTRLRRACAAAAVIGLLSGGAMLSAVPVAMAAETDYECEGGVGPDPDAPQPGPDEPTTVYGYNCYASPGDPSEGVWVFSEYYNDYWECERAETSNRDDVIGYNCLREEGEPV
ncbi:hypothetical protein ACIQ6Y_37165 [Streptomyces sp. NPDC096205]|uniref:hypothetical protein n=1 Tax=Streptomyces sp. NPDC096205 TaxID=3366081 RepID=UPI0037FA2A07